MPDRYDMPTSDAFLGGKLTLMQPRSGHRAGLDAVMLAAAAPATPGAAILDAGCGIGVVGLCIAARVPQCRITGIEIDAELVVLARENAARNGLADRYLALEADLTQPLSSLEAQGLKPEMFDVVVANPPFHGEGRGTAAAEVARNRASIMPVGGLESWVRFMTAMAAPGGRLAIVHRAEALAELLDLLEGRFGAISVYPLYPRAQDEAHRIIVTGRKGSRAGLTLKQGMVLHGEGNQFTAEAEAVLRHAAAITMQPKRGDP